MDRRYLIMNLIHICENCGKTEILTPEEAYEQGWDYPPMMGTFGIVSPRTCGDCGYETTLWRELAIKETLIDQLSDEHKETLMRILGEPDSITPMNTAQEPKIKANLLNWALVKYPEIYNNADNPQEVFAIPDGSRMVSIFGRAVKDARHDEKTGFFEDGHRIVITPVKAVKNGLFYTENSIYAIEKKNINADFQKWCKEKGYDIEWFFKEDKDAEINKEKL
jgi:hypothetical protein